jgi:hypothetical protein
MRHRVNGVPAMHRGHTPLQGHVLDGGTLVRGTLAKPHCMEGTFTRAYGLKVPFMRGLG